MWRIALVFAAVSLLAQQEETVALDGPPQIRRSAPQPTGSFTISGTVINSLTNAPIPRAQVRLNPSGQTILTDEIGAFRFSNIAGGYASLTASRPQFFGYREPNSMFKLDSDKTGLILRLSPLAVVEGKVLEADGTPVENAHVVLLHTEITDGIRSTVEDSEVNTDDRGYFRIWNLRPGAYYLKTTGRPSGAAASSNPTTNSSFQTAWDAVYFGGGQDLASAHPFTLKAGGDFRADLAIARKPTVHVRGVISGLPPRRVPEVKLFRGDEAVGSSGTRINPTNGQFDMAGVLPGIWTLRVSVQNELRGETQITVGDSDVNGIQVALNPPVDLTWSVRATGKPPEWVSLEMELETSPPSNSCVIQLHPVLTGKFDYQAHNISGLFPGSYPIAIHCPGAWVTSASWGTQNLLLDPEIRIQPNTSPPPIQIDSHFGGGTLRANFPGRNLEAVRGSGALLVPKFTGTLEVIQAAADDDGLVLFTFSNLAPGDYTLYAVAHLDQLEYRNPQVLKSLTGGTSIHIDEGQEKKLDLTKFDIGASQ
jgi:hypothetical protein